MPKKKCKLTSAEKRAERERKKKWMHIFINGKQKRVLRPEPCEWEDDEWLRQNADPITLHLMERWDLMEPEPAFEPILQPATIEELFPDYKCQTIQILAPWVKKNPQ